MDNLYLPEGALYGTEENDSYTGSIAGLKRAVGEGVILEGVVAYCDCGANLHLALAGTDCVIPRAEAVISAFGEPVRDIAVVTRVGKPVCFTVTSVVERDGNTEVRLSRAEAQRRCLRDYISHLTPGDIIPARVTHLEQFGAFVDIGCGIISLLPVDAISISRIPHPSERLKPRDEINVVVRSRDPETGRITVSLRELLGTWSENAACFRPGQTVTGIVRGVEDYGVFIELAPNLAGLAEPDPSNSALTVGARCAVYIKSIIPERMKIKLAFVDGCAPGSPPPLRYFINRLETPRLDVWRYSPACCKKVVESVF
jgi:small subunit ribosomal protein S1